MAKKKQGKKHSNKPGGRKLSVSKDQHQNRQQSPPNEGQPSSSLATTATTATTATAAAEKRLIAELYTLSRSLLASLPGCAPDGSPLAHPDHPLARLHSKLMGKVSELIALQKERASNRTNNGTRSITDRENPEAWSSFQAWLQECGIHVLGEGSDAKDFPVEIRRSTVAPSTSATGGAAAATSSGEREGGSSEPENHEYGLFATRDIAYDEDVLRIPIRAMMCPYFQHLLASDDPDSPPPPPPPFDAKRPLAQDVPLRPLCLITYLANERYRGRDSAFAPYLDTLPASSPTPLYWSVKNMRRGLALTPHLKRAVMMQAKAVWDYIQAREMIDETHKESASLIEGLIPTRDFTFELFRWATVTAHTRQNLIPFPGAMSRRHGTGGAEIDRAHGLVPLWDIINHEDSDRACRTDVEFGGDIAEGAEASGGFLVCKTPSNRTKGNVLCFHAGEEITMYYGARSNAQLLFNSGFVNCAQDIPLADAEAMLASDDGLTPPRHQFNRNRTDCAILRLALPPAAKDAGLDRIREMVAARFGFRAFTDQGIDHDGLEAAEAAAKVIETSGTVTKTTNGKGEAKASTAGTPRKATEVVMIEVEVSAKNILPIELRNALLLCVADKDELTYLLRNMDTYARDSDANTKESSGENASQNLLKLGEKHLALTEKLVEVQRRRRSKKQEFIDPASSTDCMSWKLALCNEETLLVWIHSFRSHLFESLNELEHS